MRRLVSAGTTALLAVFCLARGSLSAQQTGSPEATDVLPVQMPNTATENASTSHLPGESLARIVRLSQERGVVQMDRNTGQGFERAASNMPIVQGVRLRTAEGLAEVEFEDNSSLRLTPETEVDFPQLKLRQTGVKVSEIHVTEGSVYLSLAASHDTELAVTFNGQTLTLAPSSHVHLFVGKPVSRIAVFSGEAHVQGSLGAATATKKQTLTIDTSKAAPPLLAKGLVEDTYDQWDKNEVDYQKRYAVANSFAGSPFAYGLADLNYYGGFFNTAGCGQMWQPYFVSAGWSPYNVGLWTWYPGAGYSWVSSYPWGWTPFHSGEWAFCQGRGWGWRPTGGWNGVQNLRKLVVTTPGGSPIKPPPPPLPRHPTSTLVVHGTSVPVSGFQSTGEFRFRNDSAGLGVPHGSFDRLGKISQAVEQRGSAVRSPSDRVINTVSASAPAAAYSSATRASGGAVRAGAAVGGAGASSSRASAPASSAFSAAGHSSGSAAPSSSGSSGSSHK